MYVLCIGDQRIEFNKDPSKPHKGCPCCEMGVPKVSVRHVPIRDSDGIVRRVVVVKEKQDAAK